MLSYKEVYEGIKNESISKGTCYSFDTTDCDNVGAANVQYKTSKPRDGTKVKQGKGTVEEVEQIVQGNLKYYYIKLKNVGEGLPFFIIVYSVPTKKQRGALGYIENILNDRSHLSKCFKVCSEESSVAASAGSAAASYKEEAAPDEEEAAPYEEEAVSASSGSAAASATTGSASAAAVVEEDSPAKRLIAEIKVTIAEINTFKETIKSSLGKTDPNDPTHDIVDDDKIEGDTGLMNGYISQLEKIIVSLGKPTYSTVIQSELEERGTYQEYHKIKGYINTIENEYAKMKGGARKSRQNHHSTSLRKKGCRRTTRRNTRKRSTRRRH